MVRKDDQLDVYGRAAALIISLVLLSIIVVVVFIAPIFIPGYQIDVGVLAVTLPTLAGVIMGALGIRALNK